MRNFNYLWLVAIYLFAFLANALASTTFYTGQLGEAIEHFNREASHMRGVVFFSEADFVDPNGVRILPTAIRGRVSKTDDTDLELCFAYNDSACHKYPVPPEIILPIMEFVHQGKTNAFTLAEPRSRAHLLAHGMLELEQLNQVESSLSFLNVDREFIAKPLNQENLPDRLRLADYFVLDEPIPNDEDYESILVRFNEGKDKPSQCIDQSYTVSDYLSKFVFAFSKENVTSSGAPNKFFWCLEEQAKPPYLTKISQLLSSSPRRIASDYLRRWSEQLEFANSINAYALENLPEEVELSSDNQQDLEETLKSLREENAAIDQARAIIADLLNKIDTGAFEVDLDQYRGRFGTQFNEQYEIILDVAEAQYESVQLFHLAAGLRSIKKNNPDNFAELLAETRRLYPVNERRSLPLLRRLMFWQ